MIPPRDISIAAQRDRVPERTVEKDYAIHWITLGLATTKFHDLVLFKGGTSLRVCRFEGYRYSEDLDLTATARVEPKQAIDAFREAIAWASKRCGLTGGVADGSVDSSADGFSLQVGYSGPLGASPGRREVKVDVNFNEKVLFRGETLPVHKHYSDLPGNPKIRCYALEEVICEKFRSILNPARREPRDIYDLSFLAGRVGIEATEIAARYREKALFKGLSPERLVPTLEKKAKALKILWEKRLRDQVGTLPGFDAAYKRVLRESRKLADAL